jgi:SOS-response transcriptional repressor LexA
METLKMRAKRIVAESPALAKEIALLLQSDRPGLTPKQLKALEFLRDFRAKHGLSPTYRETADALCVSQTAAFNLIYRLHERGFIQMMPNRCRSIEIVEEAA